MGIYLPNMEMPPKGQMLVIFPDGTIYVCFNGMRERLMQTTVVSVPPHGDLIERKAICLTDFEIAMCNGDYKEGMKMLLEKIESAPTVIPAEEGE